MFTLRFDMRAPSIGAPPTELYAAASEMSAWAETRGCVAAVLCEHHCADDGYLPSPLLLGAAIAARTQQLMLNLVILLPLYDVARLAAQLSAIERKLDLLAADRPGAETVPPPAKVRRTRRPPGEGRAK